MKSKLAKRVLALAMVSTMTAGLLAGCGSSSSSEGGEAPAAEAETKEEAQTETQAADTAEAADAVAGIDGWTAFDNEVTLQVAVYDRGAEGIDSVTDNPYVDYVQANFGDKYNIKLEFVPITRSDVMTDYSLLAAAGNLPTILMEYDYPKVTQWANDGYLQTIDFDAFKQVAPTYYARMEELGQLNYSTVNGDTYFCFAERPYYNTTYTYATFVRMDWLEEVGYDHVPQNYEEYCDAMDKIIEAGIADHPAGGEMVTAASSADTGSYIYRDYPVDEKEWAQYGSLNCPALSWEPVKKMLKRINEEYNKGYLNPEYYITDAETAKANFINGKTYSYAGYMSASVDWLESFYAANPDAKLAIASQSTGVDGEDAKFAQIRSDNPYGMTIGFGFDATEEELKAAWMYMEWATLNIEELQSHTPDSAEPWNNFNNSKDFWCVTIESVKLDTIEESIAAITPQGLPQDFTEELLSNYKQLKEIADAGHAYTDPAFGVAIESESEYSQSLLSLYIEYYDQLVRCNPDEFDSLYDQLSQQYLDAGYQEVIDERAAAYEAGNSTKLPF